MKIHPASAPHHHPVKHIKMLLRELKDRALDGEDCEVLLGEISQMIFDYFQERPMSRKEASAFLNVSLPTFDKLRKQGWVIEHYAGSRKKWARPYFLRSELLLLRSQPLSGHRGLPGGFT